MDWLLIIQVSRKSRMGSLATKISTVGLAKIAIIIHLHLKMKINLGF